MKGLKRSLARGGNTAPILRRNYTLDGLVVTVDGATGNGWGTAVIGGLPAGFLLIYGAVLMATATEASADVANDFEGDVSVGSAATEDATLSGAEVDVIPSTGIAATDSAATFVAKSTASIGGTVLDNSDGSLELNLNMLIDDADIGADGVSITFNGTLVLLLAVLGDD